VKLWRWVERIGEDPADSIELRTRKRVLVVTSMTVALLAIAWGAVYLALGEPVAAIIPWTYTTAVVVSLAVFGVNRRFPWFRTTQLLLILLLPFLLQIALGGFVNASAVIIWSFLAAPLGALAMSDRREAIVWLLAYVNLVLLAQLIQPSLAIDNNLPSGVIAALFVANITAATGVAFFAVHYFVGEKDEALALLDVEREKSDRLLRNVLPKDIAETLRETHDTLAIRYPAVTVMFTDVVGFTPLADRLEADAIVAILNDVFTYFDGLVEQFGLEKIRTMGDSYMVASGVPVPRDDHAVAMAGLALAMHEYKPAEGSPIEGALSFRTGISSGPLVAGVIGRAKFQYDVWGDTVNTASRMESHSIPGKIQISETTYDLVRDAFVCEPRGEIEVKGKGTMPTWFLVGVREPAI
jgi:guanylate cyclase